MKALASFIMQSRLRAVTATAGFGAGGLALPPIGMLGSAAIALVTLRAGLGQSALVAGLAMVVLGVLVSLAGSHPALGVVLGLMQWLPAMILAEVLRRTVSWSLTLLTAAGMGAMAILLVYATVPDTVAMWVAVLQATLGPLFEQTGTGPENLEETFRQVATVMTGMLAAAMILSLLLAMIVARYWQSVLYNPGGFAREFQELQLGRVPALVLVALLGGAWAGQSNLLMELSLVLLMVYFIQGIAVVHGLSRKLAMRKFWLVGMYVLLAIAMPQMMMMLAVFGAIDSVLDFRARLGNRPGAG